MVSQETGATPVRTTANTAFGFCCFPTASPPQLGGGTIYNNTKNNKNISTKPLKTMHLFFWYHYNFCVRVLWFFPNNGLTPLSVYSVLEILEIEILHLCGDIILAGMTKNDKNREGSWNAPGFDRGINKINTSTTSYAYE